MAYVEIKREDASKYNDLPKITLRGDATFHFNSKFSDAAGLSEKRRVKVKIDEDKRRIGFVFLESDEDKNAFVLQRDGGSRGSNHIKARVIKVTQIFNQFDWIKSVGVLNDSELKKFDPYWNNIDKLWEISLLPAFEIKVSNQSLVPSETEGIYRYKRNDGTIVYIGRGKIRSRITSPERAVWDFETIEYSVISDEKERIRWESFWLDRFVKENGKLPFYNHIAGKKEVLD